MLDDFKPEELKYVYPIVGIIVVIMIITLIFIWWPTDKTMNNINTIEIKDDYIDIQKEKYSNILKSLLKISNFNDLNTKISNDWKEQNGFTSDDEVKDYLFKNLYITSYDVNIVNIQAYSSKDIYIFKYTINNNGKEVNVTINEKAPYEYNISFDEEKINSLSNLKYQYANNGVNYDIDTQYVSDSLIQYKVKVNNNGESNYLWLMKEFDKVELKLTDGSIIKCSDMTAMGINTIDVVKGTTFDFKVTFNINLEKQSMIESINFSNVYMNGNISTIIIPLNGGE